MYIYIYIHTYIYIYSPFDVGKTLGDPRKQRHQRPRQTGPDQGPRSTRLRPTVSPSQLVRIIIDSMIWRHIIDIDRMLYYIY